MSQRHVSERTKVEIKHDLQNLDLLRTKYKYIWDSEIWAGQHKVADEFDPSPKMEHMIYEGLLNNPACPKIGERLKIF